MPSALRRSRLSLFANAILGTVAFSGFALAGAVLYRVGGIPDYAITAVGVVYLPCAISLGALFALRLGEERRLNIVVSGISVVIGLYLVEVLLSFYPHGSDRRDKLPTPNPLVELKRKGLDVYPMDPARDDAASNGTAVQSGPPPHGLTGAALTRTLFCFDGAKWVFYDSDEHGFNNPAGLWQPGRIQVVLLGDSFVHGWCVNQDQTIAAHLRRRFPKSLSLGQNGMGPLLMWATLKEYVTKLQPKTVAWVYFEGNDLQNLDSELRHEFWQQYMNENFTQELLFKQDEVDRLWKQRQRANIEKAARKNPDLDNPRDKLSPRERRQPINWMVKLKLGNLRDLLGLYISKPLGNFEALGTILGKAKSMVESWGGRLYFVYLPSNARFHGLSRFARLSDRIKDSVLKVVRDYSIPIIDLTVIFWAAPSQRTLYDLANIHLSPEGYRVTAEAIAQRILASSDAKTQN